MTKELQDFLTKGFNAHRLDRLLQRGVQAGHQAASLAFRSDAFSRAMRELPIFTVDDLASEQRRPGNTKLHGRPLDDDGAIELTVERTPAGFGFSAGVMATPCSCCVCQGKKCLAWHPGHSHRDPPDFQLPRHVIER